MAIALLLSGGTGTRLGTDIPKQYLIANNKMIIEYSIETLLASTHIKSLYIVASSQWQDDISAIIKAQNNNDKFKGFAEPGSTRQLSIYNGLLAMKAEADVDSNVSVLIHDAARPCLKSSTITEMVNALQGHDGVLPVLPMKDTVYMTDETGRISSLLERKLVVAGQAPELFLYNKYLKANEDLLLNMEDMLKINGSTEPAVLAGMDVVTIPGDEGNYKITTIEDLNRFKSDIY